MGWLRVGYPQLVASLFCDDSVPYGMLLGMKRTPDLTAERVRELLDYDPTTGLFVWRPRLIRPGSLGGYDRGWNTRWACTVAGTIDKDGYVCICVDYEIYAAHLLAWLYVYSEWPPADIDHANRNPSDNRMENLRLCNQSQNNTNGSMRKDNTSGARGVDWQKRDQKWRARLFIGKKEVTVGYFDSREKAVAARRDAALVHYGEFASERDLGEN